MAFAQINSSKLPDLLNEIGKPPKKIYLAGKLLKSAPHIAIVGTRKGTSEGLAIARKIAAALSRSGITVVSGLAMGIDTAAHEGAISAGGKTVAVLPTGLDRIYPRQNENLAKKIIAGGGALISEYPENTASFPYHFIERNRIISGLSLGVIIIEAPERSGALSTARFALEQNREIFIVPGPANHPNYIGSHKLIREGARLATSAEDVLEDLGLVSPETQDLFTKSRLSESEEGIVAMIKSMTHPVTIDYLIEKLNQPAPFVQAVVGTLLAKQLVKETPDGRYHL